IMLAIRFFRSQSARGPALAGMGNAQASRFENRATTQKETGTGGSFTIPGFGGGSGGGHVAAGSEEITLAQTDLDAFQRLLTEVQEAFGREDHAALRRSVTPEMVSYLSEELADNAQKGLRNEVSEVTLLQADIAESW
ncbi:MAG: hypothetical protein E5W75_29035, partial [Mesorhizobium sp.]